MPHNEFLCVKNFEKYQHYSRRRPPWIKLYWRLLSDPDFVPLTSASKLHTIAIMLLASQYDNKIPFNKKWIQQVTLISERFNWDEILGSGFVICYQDASMSLASGKQHAITETEVQKNRSTEVQNTDTQLCEIGKHCNGKFSECQIAFDKFWASYPRHDPPRKQTRKSFCHQFNSSLDIEAMITWITEASMRWTEKKFIPQPTTFLNQQRWKGDLPPKTEIKLRQRDILDEMLEKADLEEKDAF